MSGLRAAVMVLGVTVGCAAPGAPPPTCTSAECLITHYFEGPLAPGGEPCAPLTGRLDQPLELALFHGGGADDHGVVEAASRLQRFFRPYGLSLSTVTAAAAAPLQHALAGSRADLDAALARAGIPRDRGLTEEERRRANRAMGEVMFAELRAFVRSRPPGSPVTMVVLEHVVAAELTRALFGDGGPTVTGFAISPGLFRQAQPTDPAYELWEMTGLEGAFTPVLFIGLGDLAALPGSADNLVAHELGHALSLAHTLDRQNLMTPGQNRDCALALSPAQLAQIRQGPAASTAAAHRELSSLEWLPRALDQLRGRRPELTPRPGP